MIVPALPKDAEAIANIYNHYVAETIVTFEELPVSIQEMEHRIRKITQSYPWLIALQDEQIVGFAFASPWKSRCAYRYSAESTVYLHPDHTCKGYGSRLYSQLLQELKSQNLHSVLAGISLPNPASIALHEKLGFDKVAHFKEVGFKFEQWIDVGYWELVLNQP